MACALFRVVLQELLHWLLEVEVIVIIIDIVLIDIVFLLAFAPSNVHGRNGLCNARMGMAGNMNVSMVVVLDHRLLMHGVVLVRSAADDNLMLDRPMQGINDLLGLVLISVRIGFTLRIALLSLSLLLLLGACLFVVFRLSFDDELFTCPMNWSHDFHCDSRIVMLHMELGEQLFEARIGRIFAAGSLHGQIPGLAGAEKRCSMDLWVEQTS